MRVLSAALRHVSMATARRWGAAVGRLAWHVDRRHRRTALENLEAAFHARPPAERTAIARNVFAHFGSVLFELLKVGTLPRDEFLSLVEPDGEDRVRIAQAAGRGVLFFTGHFGYWEIHAMAHAARWGPSALLARPLDNPLLNAMLEKIRERTGNTVIYREGAVRKILRELADNRGVAILIDQHLHTDAVLVDFFQRPAATTSALAALALRTGAPVIPVFALPLPGGRFRMVYEHAVDPPRPEAADALRDFTQRCTDVLEMYVRRYPGLWLWMHRRWRDRGAQEPVALDEASDAEADA